MITREELTLLDNFDDVVYGLTYQLDHSRELDFSDTEVRTEYLETFLDFQRLLGDGEYSYRKVIAVLSEVDSEGKFAESLVLVDPTVAKVQAKTSNDALYGGKTHEVPVTTKEAWERLSAKYIIEVDDRKTIDEDVEPSEEDAEYAHQITMMMEVLLPMFNKVCEISDEFTEQLIAESDAHEKRTKQEKEAPSRRDISYEDRMVIEGFGATVMALGDSLDFASGVSFEDPRSRAEFLKLFLELHACLKGENFSYLKMVEALKRLDTENKYIGFLDSVEEFVTRTQNETSDFIAGPVGKRVNDGEAFEIIEKKYLMEVDGELVPRPHDEQSPEDTGYAAQVMYMSDTLGAHVFGPLCSIAQELTK